MVSSGNTLFHSPERLVCGDQQASPLVAGRDEFEDAAGRNVRDRIECDQWWTFGLAKRYSSTNRRNWSSVPYASRLSWAGNEIVRMGVRDAGSESRDVRVTRRNAAKHDALIQKDGSHRWLTVNNAHPSPQIRINVRKRMNLVPKSDRKRKLSWSSDSLSTQLSGQRRTNGKRQSRERGPATR